MNDEEHDQAKAIFGLIMLIGLAIGILLHTVNLL